MSNETPEWLLPDKVYDVLKWVGLIGCPALATLVLAVGNSVGWADAQTAAVIITAVGTFIGVIIGASTVKGADSIDQ